MSFRFAVASLAFGFAAEAGAQQAAPPAPSCNPGSFINENAIAMHLFARPLNTWNRRDIAVYGSDVIREVINYGSRNALTNMTRQATSMIESIEHNREVGIAINWQSWERRTHPVFLPLLRQLEDNSITIAQARVRAPEIAGDYVSDGLRILSELPARPGLCPANQ